MKTKKQNLWDSIPSLSFDSDSMTPPSSTSNRQEANIRAPKRKPPNVVWWLVFFSFLSCGFQKVTLLLFGCRLKSTVTFLQSLYTGNPRSDRQKRHVENLLLLNVFPLQKEGLVLPPLERFEVIFSS